MQSLPIPSDLNTDSQATELLRLWTLNGNHHISLNLGLYDQSGYGEPEAWGIILADFVQHIATQLEQQYNVPKEQTIFDLSDMFLRELNRPTNTDQSYIDQS